jgi:putative effector of murein hydrolase
MIKEIREEIREIGLRNLVGEFLADYHNTERVIVVILGVVLVVVTVPIVWFFANVIFRAEIEFLRILEVVGVSVAMLIMFGVELAAGIAKKIMASKWSKQYNVSPGFVEEAAELGWINERGWYGWDDAKLKRWVQAKQRRPQ